MSALPLNVLQNYFWPRREEDFSFATAAETLRAAGAEGSIAILCAETTPPYHRPPLSKSFLLNGPDQTKILIHDEAFYPEKDEPQLLEQPGFDAG